MNTEILLFILIYAGVMLLSMFGVFTLGKQEAKHIAEIENEEREEIKRINNRKVRACEWKRATDKAIDDLSNAVEALKNKRVVDGSTVTLSLKEYLNSKSCLTEYVHKSSVLEKRLESVQSLLNDEIIKSTVLSAENDKLKEQNEYLKKMVATLEFNARTDQGLD